MHIIRFTAIASLIVCASAASHADDFTFEVSSPKFKVTLPGFPQLKMEVHPLNAAQPHLRYLGNEGVLNLSILTPTADAGMKPVECASARLGTLSRAPGVPPVEQIYRARINDNTYVAIYGTPLGGAVQLHAHLLSAAGGTHCIDVHVSKISRSKDEVTPWFKAFSGARIDPD